MTMCPCTSRKLTRSEHFELRDLKETIERGKHSKPPPGKAGMIWLSPEGLLDFHFYHDIVQVKKLLISLNTHVHVQYIYLDHMCITYMYTHVYMYM